MKNQTNDARDFLKTNFFLSQQSVQILIYLNNICIVSSMTLYNVVQFINVS